MFKSSDGFFTGTSVSEVISRGIPKEKIIVGKPLVKEVCSLGFMSKEEIISSFEMAIGDFGWSTGVMFEEYFFDSDGSVINDIHTYF